MKALTLKQLVLIVFLFAASCKCTGKIETINAQEENNLKKYSVVTVVDYTELSGCGFIFSLKDGAKLIPDNMPDTLKKADVKVRILYKETNIANICMAGKTISLVDVKPFE